MSIPTPVEPSRSRAAGPAVALFELPADRLPTFAAQLRRLCPQPLRFRWLPGDPDRVLVRVESPTNLLVDRFRDAVRSASVDDPAAFLEEIDHLPLNSASAFDGGIRLDRIETRLRLTPVEDDAAAQLWVLRTDALAQLTSFCRTTNELLLTRFTVAVSAAAGVPCAILRAVRGKGPPPVFLDPAEAYRPLLPFPNLYLPTNARLGPALRRDAVRDALGLRPDRVAWLHRLADGGFRPESLPETAFRPLSEWVEYKVADAVRRPEPWAQAYRLDLEPFVERTDPRPLPKPRPAEPLAKPRRVGRGLFARASDWFKGLKLRPPEPRPVPAAPPAVEEAPRPFLSQGERLHHARPETANAAIDRCQVLEAGFLQNMGARADAGDAWIELATAYDAAGNHADAALCWLNGLWSQDPIPPKLAWAWLRAEAKAARPEVKVIDPGPWLATAPGPGTTRAMAAWVVWASVQNPRPTALIERTAELQVRLEAHEHWLPVRAAWLARLATSRAGDVLGLARTRDRLSERLLTAGLSLELDTPSFLRFAGDGVRERFHEARRWLIDKRDLIHQWIARLPDDATVRGPDGSLRRFGLEPNVAQTRAYADLILVWGLTRFAEHTSADAVRRQAATGFPADDPAHTILRDAFDFRTTQVREGKPPKGPLPTHLLRQIDGLAVDPRYVVDKLRSASRVLEPTARVEEYLGAIRHRADAAAGPPAAASLSVERLNAEAGAILARERQRAGQPDLAAAMTALLGRASDLDEAAVELVCEALPAALDAARNAPPATAGLVEHGLTAAALWDRADLARTLVTRFTAATPGPAWTDVVEGLIGPATRSLRRLGLTAEVDRLLQHVVERTTQGMPPARLRVARAGDWPPALRVLLHAAGGWYGSGRGEQAHAVLDEARKDLFAPGLSQSDRTALALAYATTLGQAPVRVALGRLEEMFQRLKGVSVSGTTNTHYCLKPLVLIETAVRAIVSEDFTLGPQVRAWLDADEFAVRRRIRDDLKAVLSSQGL
jgi:cellulose synthase operon protein C